MLQSVSKCASACLANALISRLSHGGVLSSSLIPEHSELAASAHRTGTIKLLLCLGCTCASEVYGMLVVCVDCYSHSTKNEVKVRVSIGFFLVTFSWIEICGFAK